MHFAKIFTKNLRLPVRASVWYVGINLFTKGLGFIITPIFTRALSEEEYGVFALYISVLGAVGLLVSSFTGGSALYMGLKKYADDRADYYRSVLCSVFLFLTVVCTLLFAFSSYLRLDTTFCVLICLQALFDALVGIYLSVLRFSYAYKTIAAICIFEALGAPIIAVFLIRIGVNGAFARIISLLLVSAITAIFSITRLIKRGGRVRRKMVKYSYRASFPLLPHTAASAVTAEADKFLITATYGAVALAKYSVVHSVSVGLSFVSSALCSALCPWILRHTGREDEYKFREVLSLLFRILSMLTLFLLAVIPEAIRFLAPPEYYEASSAALPIALSTLPAFVTSVCTVGITHSERGGYSVRVALGAAALNVLFNFMLIPHLGYLGAGLSLLISQTFGATLALIFLRKCGKGYFSSYGELISWALLTLLFGILITMCEEFPALRVLLLIIPAIITLNSLFAAKKYIMEV